MRWMNRSCRTYPVTTAVNSSSHSAQMPDQSLPALASAQMTVAAEYGGRD